MSMAGSRLEDSEAGVTGGRPGADSSPGPEHPVAATVMTVTTAAIPPVFQPIIRLPVAGSSARGAPRSSVAGRERWLNQNPTLPAPTVDNGGRTKDRASQPADDRISSTIFRIPSTVTSMSSMFVRWFTVQHRITTWSQMRVVEGAAMPRF